MGHPFDVIGDVHGELPALEALGRELGYDVEGGWRHPEGRVPFFLGDLVDRGAHSLEVAELVRGLVEERRGFCILGNHEYNLVAWFARLPGYERPKPSNRPTTEDLGRRRTRWSPVLRFFRALPTAVELPDLRLIHACWHRPSLERAAALRAPPGEARAGEGVVDWLERHVALRSPFEQSRPLGQARLRRGLEHQDGDGWVGRPHEELLKGFEVEAPPFVDNDGKRRRRIRSVWWRDERPLVLTDRPQVFGHYWNLPPVDGEMAPPHPSGHPRLRRWAAALVGRVPERGRRAMTGDLACIDFHGVTRASDRACIGALRWPEREVVWASAPKTARAAVGEVGE